MFVFNYNSHKHPQLYSAFSRFYFGGGGVLKDDALQSAWHHGAVTSGNPAEAARIYGWISAAGSRQSGAAERCIYLNKTPSSPPRERQRWALTQTFAQAPGREQRQRAQDAIVPPRHFSYTNVPVSEPSFCTLIYTINVRVTRAQLLQTAYCRSTSPGALFRGAVLCEAQTAAARQPPLLWL